jgi:predicted RNase H-like HicB family nuclease
MPDTLNLTIVYESDEDGWIVARVLEVPGAFSQGLTRVEARDNVLDALYTVLTPDDELAGQTEEGNREHLRFVVAA